MVIIKLIGGLGNQMFQYSAGRRLAHALGTELRLDLSWFQEQKLRTFHLDYLSTHAISATREEVIRLTQTNKETLGRYLRKILHWSSTRIKSHIIERQFHFDPSILNLEDDVYLEGYWQSEKYFKDIENIIRREFTLKSPQIGRDHELCEEMKKWDAVSLHIRRGDYAKNPQTYQFHGLCSLGYYQAAAAHAAECLKNPHFYVFSDEPQWASIHLKLNFPFTIVDHNSFEKAHEDLRLMSQCRHHIIANSSFSWWGAWLNPSSEKIVIAPRQWFEFDRMDTKDLIPDGWIRI
jgi:hypothetical protein